MTRAEYVLSDNCCNLKPDPGPNPALPPVVNICLKKVDLALTLSLPLSVTLTLTLTLTRTLRLIPRLG